MMTTAWRVFATSDDTRKRPSCYLCRKRQTMVVVGQHSMQPVHKQGQAGGVKELNLCKPCVMVMAAQAVK